MGMDRIGQERKRNEINRKGTDSMGQNGAEKDKGKGKRTRKEQYTVHYYLFLHVHSRYKLTQDQLFINQTYNISLYPQLPQLLSNGQVVCLFVCDIIISVNAVQLTSQPLIYRPVSCCEREPAVFTLPCHFLLPTGLECCRAGPQT